VKARGGRVSLTPSVGGSCDSGSIIIEEWLVIEQVKAHQTSTYMVKAPPPELDAGTELALKVRVSCAEECHLQAGKVRIVDDEGAAVKRTELAEFDVAANETDEFALKAPIEPGEYTWTAFFAEQEMDGVLHEDSSVPFSFIVKPHSTSIAVWDVPSPVGFNDPFRIKVGVKCSAECNLAGHKVGVYGQKGNKVAMAALGRVPWPGTSGLYWAEVELEAPGVEGYYSWSVKFPKPELQLPHEDASYKFGLTTARPPEHVVTVEAIDKDTKSPIGDAHILLRPERGYAYRSYTDERGMARLMVPKGEYRLYVSGHEYRTFQTTVEVASDVAVKAELLLAPPSLDEDGSYYSVV